MISYSSTSFAKGKGRGLRLLMVLALLGLLGMTFIAQGTDGSDDVGVFRASNRTWYYDFNHDGSTDATSGPWAVEGYLPVAGDFDGDGVDDVGVFRPSTRIWYFDYHHDGSTDATSGLWAVEGDLPVAGDFDGDGVDDVGVFRASNRTWYYDFNHDGSTDATSGPWAVEGDLPVAGDFDAAPTPGPGPSPEPGPSEISLGVDRGCGATGTSYNLGDPIIISYQVSQPGTGVLYDFDPYVGSYGRVLPRQIGLVLPGVEYRIAGRISAARGVETLVLRVTTSTGQVFANACSFSIGGVSTELARIWTNKGCGAAAVFHHGERATISYAVAVPVTRVRIYGINPRMGLVELTPTPLTGQTGEIELTVGPQIGHAVLVVAAVTPSQGVITSSCWVEMR